MYVCMYMSMYVYVHVYVYITHTVDGTGDTQIYSSMCNAGSLVIPNQLIISHVLFADTLPPLGGGGIGRGA